MVSCLGQIIEQALSPFLKTAYPATPSHPGYRGSDSPSSPPNPSIIFILFYLCVPCAPACCPARGSNQPSVSVTFAPINAERTESTLHVLRVFIHIIAESRLKLDMLI